jgi:hypothetical protein
LGLSFDQAGNLYVGDQLHDRVARFDAASTTVPLVSGWNLVSVPLAGSAAHSMAALAASVDVSLGTGRVKAVATYTHGRFSLYVPGYTSNQGIAPSTGVFLLAASCGSWQDGGARYLVGQPAQLERGWNLVAVPYPATGMNASTIATEASDCSVQEIAAYSGGSYQVWTPGQPDVTIPATRGLWLLCQNAAVWTPH